MTWTKVDDRLCAHPKMLRAWHSHRASLGLWLLALSHAGAYLTDGHVSDAFVKTHLPSAAERRRAVGALVDAGLWEPNGTGWVIHDYLEFNQARGDVQARHPSRARPQAGADARTRASAGARVPNPSPYPFQEKSTAS